MSAAGPGCLYRWTAAPYAAAGANVAFVASNVP